MENQQNKGEINMSNAILRYKQQQEFWKEAEGICGNYIGDNINNTNSHFFLIAYELFKIANALEEISELEKRELV